LAEISGWRDVAGTKSAYRDGGELRTGSALQGAFIEHIHAEGAAPPSRRSPQDMSGLDGLIILAWLHHSTDGLLRPDGTIRSFASKNVVWGTAPA
jgi:hypothetical protein